MEFSSIKEALELIKETEAKSSALSHAMGILEYDGETIAPSASTEGRARTMGVLSGMEYGIMTDKDYMNAVKYASEHGEELGEEEKRSVQLLKKSIDDMSKIPEDFYVEYVELVSSASDVWKKAKLTNDFDLFAPTLEKIVEMNIKMVSYTDPGKDPYNALLDQYEEGLTTDTLDAFFTEVRSAIVPLVEKISKKPQIDDAFNYRFYPAAKQAELSDKLMDLEKIERDKVILGTTEHPFTTSFNLSDARITTHYYENNLVSNLFSVLHEGGHAIYDIGSEKRYEGTPLEGGCSMSIHESQSRFYENIVGRSRAFCKPLYKLCREVFPEQLADVTEEHFYKAANKSQPSLIRTEADELTYCLHVMVRYEIEKQIIGGSLAIKDVPSEWNRLYKEYLGVDVPSDTEGCLQDSHWSGGSFGYFPSYALGSAYGAQILAAMEKDCPDMWKALEQGDIAPVTEWLHEHIHKYGCLYKPGELLEKATGEKFSAKYFTDYLTKKYSEIYEL